MCKEIVSKREEDKQPGVLSVLQMSKHETDLALKFMRGSVGSDYPDLIWSMLGDGRWLEFFDALEGQNIRIPTRHTMVKNMSYIRIYSYLESRGFTESAYERAAVVFKKRVPALKKIIAKVEETFEKDGNWYDEVNEEADGASGEES